MEKTAATTKRVGQAASGAAEPSADSVAKTTAATAKRTAAVAAAEGAAHAITTATESTAEAAATPTGATSTSTAMTSVCERWQCARAEHKTKRRRQRNDFRNRKRANTEAIHTTAPKRNKLCFRA